MSRRVVHRPAFESLERRVLLCDPCGTHPEDVAPPTSVEAGGLAEQNLPDLIAWASQSRGYVYGWSIDTIEKPGRTLLRLSTASANIGDGAVELIGGPANPDGTQQVFQRIYDTNGGFSERLAGNFIYHDEHDHIHFDNYADYNLRQVTAGDGVVAAIAAGEKVSFCLLDSNAYDTSLPNAPQAAVFEECNNIAQGISVGWSDLYHKSLDDQWIDITGVSDGIYWLEVVIDPDDQLVEKDEGNNSVRIMITLNTGGSISGNVFNDPNSNGAQNAGETPLAGWTLYLDANNNSVRDAGEVTKATDAAGNYIFGSLPNGTHRVKQELPAGYRKTVPAANPGYNVAISDNDNPGRDFGNTTNILLAGKVTNSQTTNPIAGVIVDIVSNGITVASRITDASGNWQVKGLSAGTGEAKVVIPSGYVATNPAGGIYAGSMSSGQQNANLNFSLQLAGGAIVANPSTSILAARFDRDDLLAESP